jgi:hypothetical protein
MCHTYCKTNMSLVGRWRQQILLEIAITNPQTTQFQKMVVFGISCTE